MPDLEISSGDEHRLRLQPQDILQNVCDTICSKMESQDSSLKNTPKELIEYTRGFAISAPEWVIKRRGHDLIGIAQKAFGARVITPPKLLAALRRSRLVPTDLADLFARVQAF